jgi:FSR family fosmidomycin resistance protein-like MFS transporter
MMEHPATSNRKAIFSLALVQFVGFFYLSFVYPLLPVFAEKFSLTLTQVGLIPGIGLLMALIVQPSAGYLADHFRTRLFVLGGLLLAVVFIPLVGIAPCFSVLILLISLGSIGSEMLYPTSLGMVHTYAGLRLGVSVSMLEMGGILGFATGPLFIAYFVSAYGLGMTPFTMLFGLVLMAILFRIIPLPREAALKSFGFAGSIREILGEVWKSILLIWLVLVLRTFVSQSFFALIPVLYAYEGYPLVSIGIISSLFTVGGAVSCPLASRLSERIGYKPVLYLAHGLITPSLYLLLYLPGHWIYLSAFVAGFFLYSTLPLWVVMAQELAPKGRSTVSGLIVGVALGTGGMMIPLAGKMADIFSIRMALGFLAIIPLLSIGLIFMIVEKEPTLHRSIA